MFPQPEQRATLAAYFAPEQPAQLEEQRPRRGRKSQPATQEPTDRPEPAAEGVAVPPAGADDGRDPGSELG
jgi:hypothetical protein